MLAYPQFSSNSMRRQFVRPIQRLLAVTGLAEETVSHLCLAQHVHSLRILAFSLSVNSVASLTSYRFSHLSPNLARRSPSIVHAPSLLFCRKIFRGRGILVCSRRRKNLSTDSCRNSIHYGLFERARFEPPLLPTIANNRGLPMYTPPNQLME